MDLAVRLTRPPFGQDLNVELLLRHLVIAVCSPMLIEKIGRPDIGDNFSNFAPLHDGHSLWARFFDQIPDLKPTADQKNLRFNQTALAIEAAVAGQGLALAGAHYVEDDITSGRLSQIFNYSLAADND